MKNAFCKVSKKQAECRKKMFCLLCAKKKAYSVEALSMFPEKAIQRLHLPGKPIKINKANRKIFVQRWIRHDYSGKYHTFL